jgi:hypothetical protein
MFAAYRLGFHAMVTVADTQPERLRDFTFSVWHQYPLTRHGFLAFLAADDYQKHEAYANHTTLYLLAMRALYQIQLELPHLTMRVSGAMLAMAASIAAITYSIRKWAVAIWDVRRNVLILLAFAYFATLPTFWISLGKFNVDNAFVFVFPVLLTTGYLASTTGAQGPKFWISSLLLCALMPIASAQFALFLALHAIFRRPFAKQIFRSAVVLLIISVVVYMQPIIVMKLLGFSSTNSSWLFRSGLDGDMTYYGNAVNSVLFPQFQRPAYLILTPAALLLLQMCYRWKFDSDEGTAQPERTPHASLPYLFSVYVLVLLLWPQAVSIHPYLYDALLVGPLGAWIVMNFCTRTIPNQHFLLWVFILLFFVAFNLTKIAQAGHCANCYFPQWDMYGPRAG